MEHPPKSDRGLSGWWDAAGSAGAKAPAGPEFPLPGWPSQPTVEYLTKLIVLGLLLLSLPYLIGNLLLRPVETMAASARAVAPKA